MERERDFSKKSEASEGGMLENRFKSGKKIDLGDTVIDYKNAYLLKRFITDRGKLNPARVTRLSAAQQRKLAKEVKRARHLALIPYCPSHRAAKSSD